MRNQSSWSATKYEHSGRGLVASKNAAELEPSSLPIAELVARAYGDFFSSQHSMGDLLDLGCGTVPFFEAYRGKTTTITCLDWPSSPHEGRHLDLLGDLGNGLPLRDSSFDTIILSDVLEHVWNPAEFLSDVVRLLRPGGLVVLNVPFLYPIHEAPHDYHRFTKFALHRYAVEAGLLPVRICQVGGPLLSLTQLGLKLISHLPASKVLVGLSARLVVSAIRWKADRCSNPRRQTNYPLGYFCVLENSKTADGSSIRK